MADYSILVIEDDYYMRELYERVLGKNGFEVMSAADGPEGYQIAIQHQPDLIVLDIMLPGRNGLEVLKQLKEHSDTVHIPVLILSNLAQQNIIDQALESGAAEYFLKPDVDPYNLVSKITEYFENLPDPSDPTFPYKNN